MDGLTCSIPIQVSDNKVLVDNMALSKQRDSRYSLHWTQIYSPVQTKQVIGNSSACSALLQWLQCWERKCCRKKSSGNVSNKRKLRKGLNQLAADFSDPDFVPSKYSCDQNFTTRVRTDDDDTEDELSPAVLLCGPHGSGKTAAVYACAAESGFKVVYLKRFVILQQ